MDEDEILSQDLMSEKFAEFLAKDGLSFPSKAVLIFELIGEDGDRCISTTRSKETSLWDAMGLIAFADVFFRGHVGGS